mmetsp:Transcript_25549/g.42029  ORF Transcript_25549/g.42029 Transcript_25549/m.42029 type:complete len:657 (-) Transcript_25549:589-2559(-)
MDVQHIGPFILGKTLGVGSTGKVKLGTHKETGQKVAIKIVKKEFLESKPSLRKKIEREIAVMKLIDHPHVLRLYDVFETTTHLFLVLEHIEGGELFDYLVKKGKLEPQEAHRFFRQILSGLSYCHKQLICHRDLKPENLLLDAKQNIKIADFGMASMMKEGILLETSCGSPHYASPEIVMGTKYNGMEADVWSCGVVLYALMTGKLPFDDENMQRLLGKVRSGIFTMPAHLDNDAKDLVWRMLTVDPTKRITIEGIKQHPWFQKYLPEGEDADEDCDRDPPPVEPIKDWGSVDHEILRTLRTLGWGTDDALKESLTSEEPNLEKVFYRLLEIRKKERQTGGGIFGPETSLPPPSSAPQGIVQNPSGNQRQPSYQDGTASGADKAGTMSRPHSKQSAEGVPAEGEDGQGGAQDPGLSEGNDNTMIALDGDQGQDSAEARRNAQMNAQINASRRHSQIDASSFSQQHSESNTLNSAMGGASGENSRRSLDSVRNRSLFMGAKPQWISRSKKEGGSGSSTPGQTEDSASPPLPPSVLPVGSPGNHDHVVIASPKRNWWPFGREKQQDTIYGLHSTKPISKIVDELHKVLANNSIPWQTLSDTCLRVELADDRESPRLKMQIELKPMTDHVVISFSKMSGDQNRCRGLYERIQKDLSSNL